MLDEKAVATARVYLVRGAIINLDECTASMHLLGLNNDWGGQALPDIREAKGRMDVVNKRLDLLLSTDETIVKAVDETIEEYGKGEPLNFLTEIRGALDQCVRMREDYMQKRQAVIETEWVRMHEALDTIRHKAFNAVPTRIEP